MLVALLLDNLNWNIYLSILISSLPNLSGSGLLGKRIFQLKSEYKRSECDCHDHVSYVIASQALFMMRASPSITNWFKIFICAHCSLMSSWKQALCLDSSGRSLSNSWAWKTFLGKKMSKPWDGWIDRCWLGPFSSDDVLYWFTINFKPTWLLLKKMFLWQSCMLLGAVSGSCPPKSKSSLQLLMMHYFSLFLLEKRFSTVQGYILWDHRVIVPPEHISSNYTQGIVAYVIWIPWSNAI